MPACRTWILRPETVDSMFIYLDQYTYPFAFYNVNLPHWPSCPRSSSARPSPRSLQSPPIPTASPPSGAGPAPSVSSSGWRRDQIIWCETLPLCKVPVYFSTKSNLCKVPTFRRATFLEINLPLIASDTKLSSKRAGTISSKSDRKHVIPPRRTCITPSRN